VPVPEAGDDPWLPASAESGNGTRPASVVGVGVVGVGVVGVGVVGVGVVGVDVVVGVVGCACVRRFGRDAARRGGAPAPVCCGLAESPENCVAAPP
jgi:hypothetical protein